MHDNYHKLSRLFIYLDYFNPQINYLGLAQIILKLSPICDAFADDYWGLKLLSHIILKLSPICGGFSSIRVIYCSLQPSAGQNHTKNEMY